MYTKAAIALILLIGTVSSGLASPPQNQTLDGLAAAMRIAIGQGLFAEEYDTILEVAQNDPQFREKIIEHLVASPK
jgi:hypothetical protein